MLPWRTFDFPFLFVHLFFFFPLCIPISFSNFYYWIGGRGLDIKTMSLYLFKAYSYSCCFLSIPLLFFKFLNVGILILIAFFYSLYSSGMVYLSIIYLSISQLHAQLHLAYTLPSPKYPHLLEIFLSSRSFHIFIWRHILFFFYIFSGGKHLVSICFCFELSFYHYTSAFISIFFHEKLCLFLPFPSQHPPLSLSLLYVCLNTSPYHFLSFSIIVGWKVDELRLQLADIGHGACWGERGFDELGEGWGCVGIYVLIFAFYDG
ncbi:hypothetical protein DFH27DRAFT_111094 [Peziza echinospora]|nr:hypothetical protein DFH27DRAFT_111094 [Peziza echinospora]